MGGKEYDREGFYDAWFGWWLLLLGEWNLVRGGLSGWA